MRFKVDENLPVEVAAALREAGHDAPTVLDQEAGGMPDTDLAGLVKREGRVLVTLDQGFGDIRSHPPGEFSGLVVETGGIPTPINDPTEFQRRIRDDAFPPAMSYFDPTKRTTSCVNFIEEQRTRYATLVGQADVVAIVGVNVRPNDEHIWQALGDTPATILYCSGTSAGKVFDEWSCATRAGRGNYVLSGYFEENFEALCEGLGL